MKRSGSFRGIVSGETHGGLMQGLFQVRPNVGMRAWAVRYPALTSRMRTLGGLPGIEAHPAWDNRGREKEWEGGEGQHASGLTVRNC